MCLNAGLVNFILIFKLADEEKDVNGYNGLFLIECGRWQLREVLGHMMALFMQTR